MCWLLPENILDFLCQISELHVGLDAQIESSPCFGDVHIKSNRPAMAATTWELGIYCTLKDGTVVH